jgi:DNA-binding NarL/FixJ family response regulator
MNPIRVLLADDHAVVRKGIQMFLSTEPSIQLVGEAADCQDTIRKVTSLQPEVVLMDLVMPQGSGLETIAEIKHRLPNVKIIVLTMFEDHTSVTVAMKAGADGYLLKDAEGEKLLQAIHSVQRGEVPLDPRVARYLAEDYTSNYPTSGGKLLTKREKEILRLLANGLSNHTMAQELNISQDTVKAHVSSILRKLNASGRTEAAVWATQMGLIALDEGDDTVLT